MRLKFMICNDEKQDDFTFFYKDEKWFRKISTNLGYDECSYRDIDLEIFSQMPNIVKADILKLFEFSILNSFWSPSIESDELVAYEYNKLDNLNEDTFLNAPKPTYISEYINTIGQLFLAGYIDFGSYCDNEDKDKIDYPTNLSYYKEDKYQAWIHFRDNFFYTNRFNMDLDDPTTIDNEGYGLILSDTFWDTPQYWSQYNIWVARTEKGTKYFNEILAPKFYEKYKDLEVEIDDRGNIVRWIGEINRDNK